MTNKELIAELQKLPLDAEVVIEDLNGCLWVMDPTLIRFDSFIVLGDKDINVVEMHH